jgi:hypothetical protein
LAVVRIGSSLPSDTSYQERWREREGRD